MRSFQSRSTHQPTVVLSLIQSSAVQFEQGLLCYTSELPTPPQPVFVILLSRSFVLVSYSLKLAVVRRERDELCRWG